MSKGKPKKELQQLFDEIAQRGWSWSVTKRSHYKITKPGRRAFYTGSTPSDPRAVKNLRAAIAACDRLAEQNRSKRNEPTPTADPRQLPCHRGCA